MGKESMEYPTSGQLELELKRLRHKREYHRTLRSTIYILVTVAAAAVLAAMLFMPVLQVHGASMSPALSDGDMVISLGGTHFQRGDMVAFYYNNEILIKRIIAMPGEWVDIDEGGHVSIDKKPLDEPYIEEFALGQCDIELPYQVPDGRYFMIGDHRGVSMDSRNSVVGCVPKEQIVGSLEFRFWPFNQFGPLR